ncbi:MAG TPA: SpoIIE family protein phosphatase [Nitrospiria bacterium]|nr:SpoIIE family protein phosphatase [Nitrospiria bacterium]
MKAISTEKHPCIEWGVGSRGLTSEVESGDAHIVQLLPKGALVAVVDGLGHGSEAASAARKAVDCLSNGASGSVISLLTECHRSLQGTRGVVMSLALFNSDDQAMMWTGVGNVTSVLYRADSRIAPSSENLLPRAGIVGYVLPPLRAAVLPVSPGDTLVMASDGIRDGFVVKPFLKDPPQQIADRILSQHAKETDDALVLVVRYRGRLP